MQKFSIKEAVSFGFQITKSNLKFFIPLLLIYYFLQIIPGFITSALQESSSPTFIFIILIIVIGVAGGLLRMLMDLGILRIALNFVDKKTSKLSDLFSQTNILFKYLLTSILYVFIVIGGLILFIIPGIIWAIKFQFFSYALLDKALGPIEALKYSWEITKGVKLNLLLFSFLLGLINILGALALVVGLFLTIPTSLVAQAFVYRKLAS